MAVGPSEPWPRPLPASIIPTYEGELEILSGPAHHHLLEHEGLGEQAYEQARDPSRPQDHRLQGLGIREPSLGSTTLRGGDHERRT
jgi:hypothetical protein